MNTGYMYIVCWIASHLLFVFIVYRMGEHRGLLMEKLMISMALSMVFGLSIGVLTGIIYHGNLLLATLFSMVTAGIVGAILGVGLHPLASAEGFFSALMAGMMGSMIAEMLTFQEGHALLLISLLFLSATTMFCIRHILFRTFEHFVRQYDTLLLIGACGLLFLLFWTFPDVQNLSHP